MGQRESILENLVGGTVKQFADIYRGKRVFVTGHTGFKGSWLVLWLKQLGANVHGYSLPAPTDPSHWDSLHLDISQTMGDIRDGAMLEQSMRSFQPEIVFHLAAQPIVRESYITPIDTFETNVIGSLEVYNACRKTDSVKTIVSITTDKVYENREWPWGYRENDPLGGHDPYSASKACADIATTSWQRSFLPLDSYGKTHNTLLATARAGNVIGGGDWAKDRLIPDLMRGAAKNVEAIIRNPQSTRPWEHVLEPLSGYLLLGQKLLEGQKQFAKAWNFGPASEGVLNVGSVIQEMSKAWDKLRFKIESNPNAPHEAGLLTLDCSMARHELKWKPIWDGIPCFEKTAEWYKAFLEDNSIISLSQLERYLQDALNLNASWIQE